MNSIKANFRRLLLIFVWGSFFILCVTQTTRGYGDESRKDFKIHLREFKKALAKEDLPKAEESLVYLLKIYGDKKEYVSALNSAGNNFRQIQAITQKKALQKGVTQVQRFMAEGQLTQADELVEDLRKRYPDAEPIGYLDREVQSRKYEALQKLKGRMDAIGKLIDQNKDQEALSQALQLQASQKYIPPSYQQDLDTIVRSIQQNTKPLKPQNTPVISNQATTASKRSLPDTAFARPAEPNPLTKKEYRGSDEIIQWQKQAGVERLIDESAIAGLGQKALDKTVSNAQDSSAVAGKTTVPVVAGEKKERKPMAWWPFRKTNKKEEVKTQPKAIENVKVFKSLSAESEEIKQIERFIAEKKWAEAKGAINQLQTTYPQDPQLQALAERVTRQEAEVQQRRKAVDESLQRAYTRQQEKKVDQTAILNDKQKIVHEALQQEERQRGSALTKEAVVADKKKKSIDTILQKKSIERKNEELREIRVLYKKGRFEEAQQRIDPLCKEYPEDAASQKLAGSIKRKVDAASRKKQEQEAWLQKRREQREKNIDASRPNVQGDSDGKAGAKKLSPKALKEKSVYIRKIFSEAVKSYQDGLYADTIRLCDLVIKLEKDTSAKYTAAARKLLEKAQKNKR